MTANWGMIRLSCEHGDCPHLSLVVAAGRQSNQLQLLISATGLLPYTASLMIGHKYTQFTSYSSKLSLYDWLFCDQYTYTCFEYGFGANSF